MLNDLPAELAIKNFSYLDIRSLAAASAVSKLWHALIEEYKELIYRYAALTHRFIDTYDVSLQDTIAPFGEHQMAGVQNWKQYCQRRYEIETNWLGFGRGAVRVNHKAAGSTVGRFKVDETAGLIIATQTGGGLIVSDMFSRRQLWALDKEYLFEPAHCEYDNGYLVFDDPWGQKEIWRLSSTMVDGEERAEESPPQPRQLEASKSSDAKYGFHFGDRGHFVPWGYLIPPRPGRAYRVVYPHLCVVASNEAYIWDLPSGRLVQILTETASTLHGQPLDVLGAVRYVEINDKYVFICGKKQLRIYDRHNQGNLIYSISTRKINQVYAYHLVNLESLTLPVPCRLDPLQREWEASQHFMAVHVWDNYMALLTGDARLVIVRDYEKVIHEGVRFGSVQHTIILDLTVQRLLERNEQEGRYLAFNHGKIGVATMAGVVVVYVDPSYHGVDFTTSRGDSNIPRHYKTSLGDTDDAPPWPYRFGTFPLLNPFAGSGITCLQVARHEILVAMLDDPEDVGEEFERNVVGWSMLPSSSASPEVTQD